MEHWTVKARGADILITCRGHDKEKQFPRVLSEFRVLANPREEFAIYADLSAMTGYESEARQGWQVLLREYHTRVRKIVFIGARFALIRMGAAAVGAFAGIPVKFIDNWDELAQRDHSV
jgi:hypothetical protein